MWHTEVPLNNDVCCTKWIKWPCERPYLSCLIAAVIPLFLSWSLPVFARTNRQAGSSAGVLDYWIYQSSLPSEVGDSYFSLGLSLQTWSGSTYQFSLPCKRQKPHVRTPTYPVSRQYRPQSQAYCWVGVVHVRDCTAQFAQREVS